MQIVQINFSLMLKLSMRVSIVQVSGRIVL